MPYLGDVKRRMELDPALGPDEPWGGLASSAPHDGAELNYVICRLADAFIHDHGLSYHVLEEVIGALECAKQEIVRRIIGPYEALKMEQNGDVFAHTAPMLAQVAAALTGAGLPTDYQQLRASL